MVHRFFSSTALQASSRVALSRAASHHAQRVLRLAAGETVVLFDGRGGEYPGVLEFDGREAHARLAARQDADRESPLDITLAQGLPSAERMDFLVQKAVELGVRRIQPLALERCVTRLSAQRAQRRLEHWQGIIIAACEQCGRNRLPEIAAPLTLTAWLAQLPASAAQRLQLAPHAGQGLRDLPAAQGYLLLVGPEGGLSEAERAQASASGFLELGLGPRILRSETAGPAVLAALAALHGDF